LQFEIYFLTHTVPSVYFGKWYSYKFWICFLYRVYLLAKGYVKICLPKHISFFHFLDVCNKWEIMVFVTYLLMEFRILHTDSKVFVFCIWILTYCFCKVHLLIRIVHGKCVSWNTNTHIENNCGIDHISSFT
jgi:hypothetical protein